MSDVTLDPSDPVGDDAAPHPTGAVAHTVADVREHVAEVREHVAEVREHVAEQLAQVKPLLRGWIHEIFFFLSIPAGLLLVALSGTVEARLAAAVYSLGVTALYGVSAAYHRGPWTEKGRIVMRRLDHAMIFVLIAATYTPFCILLLDGASQWLFLGAIWFVALAGLTLALTGISMKHGIGFVLYIAMGWAAVFALPQFVSGLTPVQLGLMLAGGIFYTAGAIFLATRWPDPFPRVFGYHEVWHVMTVLAGICLAIDIWWVSLSA